ncbi:5-oxoprolinase subunit PxpA [Hyphomonas sp.]|uniref:5-oxoprolinase subunit PxpA n=1 Tax=Hyphomonas sp. TaxID=87 RepID=UPI00391A7555
MTRSICLNADLGELPGPEGRALDAAILGIVTRCSIACGGHAGDEASMRETVQRASAYGVRIGAHPSYPDRPNFGRLSLQMAPEELAAALDDQVEALLKIASEEGASITHLKPHGALYNDSAKNPGLARMIVQATQRAGLHELVGPPKSALELAARDAALVYIAEGFADRTYESDGALTPRSVPGAVISDENLVEAVARRMALEGVVIARTGETLSLGIRTICLHSDTPGAAQHAAQVRAALQSAGVRIEA